VKKFALLTSSVVLATGSAFAELAADPSTGLSEIEGYADSALVMAIAIGSLVIGWGYIKRLIKKG
jgi:hypothetical protein